MRPGQKHDQVGERTNLASQNQTAGFYYVVVDAMLETGFMPEEIERIGGTNYLHIFAAVVDKESSYAFAQCISSNLEFTHVRLSLYQVTLADAGSAIPQGFTWSGFAGASRLGVHHIAEGTDHLLFLLTLLLPAPLLALAGRWNGRATVRRSLTQILRIVTAFTLGHSLTLALSSFGLVRPPSRPVEVLIAVSILVSAIRALRPLFPGREAIIAASFGLIYGLALASALNELGVTGWYRLISVVGFIFGIEAMQLAVVTVTLPALLLLSRTKSYSAFRITGADFASMSSCAWIVERVLDQPNTIGHGIESLSHHGVMVAIAFWACSAVAWKIQGPDRHISH